MSDISASSTYFIEFLLQLLLDTIEETLETEKKVTANQKKIIECLRTNPYITMDELSEKVGISRKSIAANIKKLKTLGYISRIGADKNGYWQVEEM
jgi:predicted HTH transcriptional regulator